MKFTLIMLYPLEILPNITLKNTIKYIFCYFPRSGNRLKNFFAISHARETVLLENLANSNNNSIQFRKQGKSI